MKISVIKIGNSKGIRLSKTLLDKYKIKDEVEIQLKEDFIIIKPVESIRNGWDEAFKAMGQDKDDSLLIDDVFEDEDLEEWK